MNIQNMERIILVAEEKNITAASKKLYISQPTLSTMIHSMEKEIGNRIFERQGKSLKLTQSGEQYIKTVKRMLTTWNSFKDDINNVNEGIIKKIRIGISQRRSLSMLPSVLPLFTTGNPRTGIKLESCITDFAEPMLTQSSIDLVFSNHLINLPKIKNIKLQNEIIVISSHKESKFSQKYKKYIYTGKGEADKKMPFLNLNNESLILLNVGEDERTRYYYMAEEANISNFVPIEVFSSIIAQELVKNKIGTAILPKNISKSGELLPKCEDVNYFLIDSLFANRQYYLSYDTVACNSKQHQELIQIIIDTFGYN